jgi:hypothetical protein
VKVAFNPRIRIQFEGGDVWGRWVAGARQTDSVEAELNGGILVAQREHAEMRVEVDGNGRCKARLYRDMRWLGKKPLQTRSAGAVGAGCAVRGEG